jgi:hypothetical protein
MTVLQLTFPCVLVTARRDKGGGDKGAAENQGAARVKLSDFDFDLPEDLIATRPVHPRPAARLLHAEGGRIATGTCAICRISCAPATGWC